MTGQLETAVWQTVRWFDLLDQPVTAVQIWRNLIAAASQSNWRWAGSAVCSLEDVEQVVQASDWLKRRLESKWGYYFMKGRGSLVEKRLVNHARAQAKLKRLWRLGRWIKLVPGIKMLAVSGSLSLGSARPESDLDVLVAVVPGRLWLTRLLLLTAAQLTGKRRKYWNREAPDKLCLNHIISVGELSTHRDIRNLYMAIQYQHALPLFGMNVFEKWRQVNGVWIRRQLMIIEAPTLPSLITLKEQGWIEDAKTRVESWLAVPALDWLEKMAERLQRRFILKHTRPGISGRVILSPAELAFHPDSKVPGILERFYQEEGQGKLL